MTIAEFRKVTRNQFEQPGQDEGDDEDGNDFWHLVSQKIERVIAPVVENLESTMRSPKNAKIAGPKQPSMAGAIITTSPR